ncbi:MAG TPA: DUF3037 domain-containing protein [Flavobacterium sp.]|jgi:hypothetical protein
MQELHLYEYAVIRVVPRVEREEFINVGLILFCKKAKYLHAYCAIDESRLCSLHADLDIDQIKMNLRALEKITSGANDGGPIALMEVPERFRWLTAIRSSVIQTSRPHPGLSADLDVTFQRLLTELVL